MWSRLLALAAALGLACAGVGLAIAQPAPGPAPASPAAETSGDANIDKMVDGISKRYANVTDFKARFSQTVERKHLPRPLKKDGFVYFKKPGMMRWDYAQPEPVLYASDGDVLWSYQPSEGVAYKMNVKGSELYDALKFLFGQGDLRQDFNLALAPPRTGWLGLELTPKVAQSNYKLLRLFVDPKTWSIHETELVDPLDNISRIRFEDATYEPLKAQNFHFTPPPGVRVEDLQHQGPKPAPPSPR